MELNATFFLQLAIFFVLLALLTPVIFDPFMRLFDERNKRIVGASEEAKRLGGSADERAMLIEARTKEAQAEARQVLSTLRAQAQEKEAAIIAAARQKSADRLEEARADLFSATEEARRTLRDEAKKLSGDIVQKVLGRAA